MRLLEEWIMESQVKKMEFDEIIELLQTLLYARGPCGEEEEVRTLCFRLFKEITDDVWLDPFGNLIGKVCGKVKEAPAIRLMAHMDEISMIVKPIMRTDHCE